MLVKCQRSQFDSEGRSLMLFYNNSRSYQETYHMTPEWKKRFDKYGEKFFARVTVLHPEPPQFLVLSEDPQW